MAEPNKETPPAGECLTERDHLAIESVQRWLQVDGLPRLAEHIRPHLNILDQKISRVQREAKLSAADSGNGVATNLSPGVVNAIAQGIVPYVKEQLGLRDARIAELEKRIAELEARPGLKYHGVWDEQQVYSVGDFVTDHGSMWHCWDTNRGVRPGSSDAWQLAVQRGKSARDRR